MYRATSISFMIRPLFFPGQSASGTLYAEGRLDPTVGPKAKKQGIESCFTSFHNRLCVTFTWGLLDELDMPVIKSRISQSSLVTSIIICFTACHREFISHTSLVISHYHYALYPQSSYVPSQSSFQLYLTVIIICTHHTLHLTVITSHRSLSYFITLVVVSSISVIGLVISHYHYNLYSSYVTFHSHHYLQLTVIIHYNLSHHKFHLSHRFSYISLSL